VAGPCRRVLEAKTCPGAGPRAAFNALPRHLVLYIPRSPTLPHAALHPTRLPVAQSLADHERQGCQWHRRSAAALLFFAGSQSAPPRCHCAPAVQAWALGALWGIKLEQRAAAASQAGGRAAAGAPLPARRRADGRHSVQKLPTACRSVVRGLMVRREPERGLRGALAHTHKPRVMSLLDSHVPRPEGWRCSAHRHGTNSKLYYR
jgi:hypothetical protein